MRKSTLLLIVIAATCLPLRAQKLTADEIVAKHLEAIGTATARDFNKNTSIVGEVFFELGSTRAYTATGKAVYANDGNKVLFALTLPSVKYPMEKVIFDGKSINVAFINAGARSDLGQFIQTNDGMIKEGLFGGIYAKSWILTDVAGRKVRITLDGSKKIDGRDNWVLSVEPKRQLGLSAKVFIDKETFRHVRTEYSHVLPARIGRTPETSSAQSESYENLVEEFADFKVENGLMLPRFYKISLYLQLNGALREYRYTFKFKEYYYNQKLDPATFMIGQN